MATRPGCAARSHRPGRAYQRLPDYTPYAAASKRSRIALRKELERLDLGKNRRVSFYPLGSAYALMLDSTRPGWKQMYESTPFVMTALLKEEE